MLQLHSSDLLTQFGQLTALGKTLDISWIFYPFSITTGIAFFSSQSTQTDIKMCKYMFEFTWLFYKNTLTQSWEVQNIIFDVLIKTIALAKMNNWKDS